MPLRWLVLLHKFSVGNPFSRLLFVVIEAPGLGLPRQYRAFHSRGDVMRLRGDQSIDSFYLT
jgi:hypothetical protein